MSDARRIIDTLMYMTLATADQDGRPWASPVWFARASDNEFLWASDPESRHSRNLATRPELAIVIFDSTVPIGSAEAVYLEAVGGEVPAADLERAVAVYSRRSVEVGATEWTLEDVTPPARFRLYRANVSAASVLGPSDRRLPIELAH
jgi:hypothetical protein